MIIFLDKTFPFMGSNFILGPKSYLKQYSIILTNRAVPNLAILLLECKINILTRLDVRLGRAILRI